LLYYYIPWVLDDVPNELKQQLRDPFSFIH
jgi:hypothetical protein